MCPKSQIERDLECRAANITELFDSALQLNRIDEKIARECCFKTDKTEIWLNRHLSIGAINFLCQEMKTGLNGTPLLYICFILQLLFYEGL